MSQQSLWNALPIELQEVIQKILLNSVERSILM